MKLIKKAAIILFIAAFFRVTIKKILYILKDGIIPFIFHLNKRSPFLPIEKISTFAGSK